VGWKVGLDELDELIYELDQTLHSILNDSELALQDGDGSGPFRGTTIFRPTTCSIPTTTLFLLT